MKAKDFKRYYFSLGGYVVAPDRETAREEIEYGDNLIITNQEILKESNVSEEDIKNIIDSGYWVEYLNNES